MANLHSLFRFVTLSFLINFNCYERNVKSLSFQRLLQREGPILTVIGRLKSIEPCNLRTFKISAYV